MGGIDVKSFLPFDRKLILVSNQVFLYKSRPNFPSIFTAMYLLINSIDTARDTSFLPFDRKLILVRDQLFLYKSRPNFPSIFNATYLLINSIDTAWDTSVKMFHIFCCKNWVDSYKFCLCVVAKR